MHKIESGPRTADLRGRIGRKRARMASASKSRGPQGRGRMPMTEGETRRSRNIKKEDHS